VPGRNEMETKENYGAVCCAVQNLTLSAQEEGVVAGWSTGGICQHPRLAETLGADPAWDMVAMLYMGYPTDTPPNTMQRGPAEKFTMWVTDQA
jgi:nitroreductase